MGSSLPPALTRHLADATVEVASWSAAAGELVLRIRKEIGPESGVLRFGGVGLVYLPPRFTIAVVVATPLPAGDTLYEIAEAWGESYSVVAASAQYAADAGPDSRPSGNDT